MTSPSLPSTRYNPLCVLAFVVVWFVFPLGIVLGYLGTSEVARTHERGKALGVTALILGWFPILAGVSFVLYTFQMYFGFGYAFHI